MRLHKTGHSIADTVSDLIGDLPDGDYKAAYGILRHELFTCGKWFEFDRGFWNAEHFEGNYRLSFCGTQPRYDKELFGYPERLILRPHDLDLQPWRIDGTHVLILPPTGYVCDFFKINYTSWMLESVNMARKMSLPYIIRNKGSENPLSFDGIKKVITFNSTLAIEAIKRGIEVISDPIHSTLGSYTQEIQKTIDYDRDAVLDFIQAHQFRLKDKDKICRLIQYYLSKSSLVGMIEKQSPQTF